MTEQELQEIMQMLEAQGFRPMLCDTPVPYYDNGVRCEGTAHRAGHEARPERVYKKLVKTWPCYVC